MFTCCRNVAVIVSPNCIRRKANTILVAKNWLQTTIRSHCRYVPNSGRNVRRAHTQETPQLIIQRMSSLLLFFDFIVYPIVIVSIRIAYSTCIRLPRNVYELNLTEIIDEETSVEYKGHRIFEHNILIKWTFDLHMRHSDLWFCYAFTK